MMAFQYLMLIVMMMMMMGNATTTMDAFPTVQLLHYKWIFNYIIIYLHCGRLFSDAER